MPPPRPVVQALPRRNNRYPGVGGRTRQPAPTFGDGQPRAQPGVFYCPGLDNRFSLLYLSLMAPPVTPTKPLPDQTARSKKDPKFKIIIAQWARSKSSWLDNFT